MKKKIALVMATITLAVVAVGATLAWFTDSEQVTNTFTVGNIYIDIDETNVEGQGRDKANSYKLIPGTTHVKDPKITVKANSERCYLFMEVDTTYNTVDGITVVQYEINEDDWTLVDGTTNVYYYKSVIEKSASDKTIDSTVFKTKNGKQITVNENLTKEMVEKIDGKNDDGSPNTDEKTPQIVVTGYAVQADGISDFNEDGVVDAIDAWSLV